MAAIASYLADTSALARLGRPTVDAALAPLIEAGNVATCGMVELESLCSSRSAGDYSGDGNSCAIQGHLGRVRVTGPRHGL